MQLFLLISAAFIRSIGSSGRVGGGGPRNMKSMGLPLAAIVFMTYFYRGWGTMAPSAPPLDPLLIRGVYQLQLEVEFLG